MKKFATLLFTIASVSCFAAASNTNKILSAASTTNAIDAKIAAHFAEKPHGNGDWKFVTTVSTTNDTPVAIYTNAPYNSAVADARSLYFEWFGYGTNGGTTIVYTGGASTLVSVWTGPTTILVWGQGDGGGLWATSPISCETNATSVVVKLTGHATVPVTWKVVGYSSTDW